MMELGAFLMLPSIDVDAESYLSNESMSEHQ